MHFHLPSKWYVSVTFISGTLIQRHQMQKSGLFRSGDRSPGHMVGPPDGWPSPTAGLTLRPKKGAPGAPSAAQALDIPPPTLPPEGSVGVAPRCPAPPVAPATHRCERFWQSCASPHPFHPNGGGAKLSPSRHILLLVLLLLLAVPLRLSTYPLLCFLAFVERGPSEERVPRDPEYFVSNAIKMVGRQIDIHTRYGDDFGA